MTPIKSLWLAGALAILSAPAMADETIDYPGLGRVTIYQPAGPPKSFVIFVSGDGGWNLGVVGMAQHLVAEGALVAGVDINTMGKQLLASRAAWVYPAETLEALSHFVQQKYGIRRYESPILVGYSSGATVVYATLAQSPCATAFTACITVIELPRYLVERVKDISVEMLPPALVENLDGRIEAEGLVIGPFRGERIENIGDCKDAGCHRDVPSAQIMGIAAPSILLMMIAGN